MKSPNEVKMEILEEFKSRFTHEGHYYHKDSIEVKFESLLSQSLDRYKDSIVEGLKSGLLCTSCGKPKEDNLADWCGECFENN